MALEHKEKFIIQDYVCHIVMIDGKYYCGYVEIPKNHFLYGVNLCSDSSPKIYALKTGKTTLNLLEDNNELFKNYYDYNILSLFEVHGGVTFSNTHKGLEDGKWYLGIDCSHLGDLLIGQDKEKYPYSTFKDSYFVKDELHRLVDQLVIHTKNFNKLISLNSE